MSSQRGVHNRIHTLRGEQFRHLQNLRGSRSHLSSTNIHSVPSLPLRLLSLADPSLNLTNHVFGSIHPELKFISNNKAGEPESDGTSPRSPAGPSPPKSWTLNSRKDIRETATWRTDALSLVFSELANPRFQATPSNCSAAHERPVSPEGLGFHPPPHVPPLSLLCLQIFLNTCTNTEFRDEIVPYIPPHLRKDLIRFTAIHSPLTSSRLYALLEPTRHADGEIIVVGPGVTLRDDYFIRSHPESGHGVRNDVSGSSQQAQDWDWDTDDTDQNSVLSTLILLNTSISSSILFSFPPTLTHVVLINLSMPVPIHRLPTVCPLVVMLDVSYNSWLGTVFSPDGQGGLLKPQQQSDPTIKAIVDIGRVDWVKWGNLRVLGFRGNYVPENFVKDVNEGRWEDIMVIL